MTLVQAVEVMEVQAVEVQAVEVLAVVMEVQTVAVLAVRPVSQLTLTLSVFSKHHFRREVSNHVPLQLEPPRRAAPAQTAALRPTRRRWRRY